VNVVGRPIGLLLGPGQQADIRAADDLVATIGPFDRLIADRAYDADAFRQKLGEAGVRPIIPGRSNRQQAIRHDRRRYKQRWQVEATIGRLKDFRRVATHYDKLARTFLDTVALAAIYMFWL
jgi:transposase